MFDTPTTFTVFWKIISASRLDMGLEKEKKSLENSVEDTFSLLIKTQQYTDYSPQLALLIKTGRILLNKSLGKFLHDRVHI